MVIKLNKAFKNAKKTDKRYRILYGGAGSGKSHYMGQETILNMLSNKEYSYLIVRKTNKSIRNSVFKLLCDIISEYDLTSKFHINKTEMSIRCLNGSTVITSGLDDVEKLKSIAGVNRIWVEEASEISEQDFNQLDLRLRGINKVGYQMTLTFNPISELHWLKRVFFDLGSNEAFVLKTTYLDNSHLDEKYIGTLERLKEQDYQYYRIYALGDWGSLGNLIFTNWEKADLRGNNFDNFFNGGDWGFADDPFAAVRVHYDKMRKTLYITDEIYQRGLHNDQSAELVKEMIGNENITMDSAEPKSVADFKRLGVRTTAAKKGQGSVEHGIKWLQGNKIIVDERCINTIKELTSYKWREDKSGNVIPKPVDMNNHIIDALRYALEPEMTQNKWGF
jgi:phage terminase large subunit